MRDKQSGLRSYTNRINTFQDDSAIANVHQVLLLYGKYDLNIFHELLGRPVCERG